MVLELDIPNFGSIKLSNLVLDLNGTIAATGQLIPKIIPLITQLKQIFNIYIVSADTFGKGTQIANELGVELFKLKREPKEVLQKGKFIKKLGSDTVVALGNGRNDAIMLKFARIGIAIIGKEGCAKDALLAADLIFTSPVDALKLLLSPKGLKASLRS